MTHKVVVIGTGFGEQAVAPAYRAAGFEVTVVSPRDSNAVTHAIQAPCDLVSIHSPPFLHLEHVTLAARHGRAVLCDKPFGRNGQDAWAMLELVEQAKVRHFLNFEFRCDPLRERVKALLEGGAIGTPLHMNYTMFLSRGRQLPHGWLFQREQGGGWIGAFVSHVVDMLHWWFGDVESLSCCSRIDWPQHRGRDSGDARLYKATAEDAVSAWFRLSNGTTVMLDTGFSAAVNLPPQITILGTEGCIRFGQGPGLELQRAGAEPEEIPVAMEGNPVAVSLQRWFSQVGEAIKNDQQIAPDFNTGLSCARVLDQLRRADVSLIR
ncbi:MAG: oxidoreductase [Pseudomonadales bacterium]|nr:oxidoreductase [Pseudomonadales bacterium]